INNNSGQNANNIQVAGSGLSVSYTVGNSVYSAIQMMDGTASGVGGTQTIGNLALFDPNNCVTYSGSKVQTLSTGGGRCTFYLQLVGESLPVGVYPIDVNVSYTNGNTSNSVSAIINQRVNLYLAGKFSANPSVMLTNAQNSANQLISANYPDSDTTMAITRDSFGNVYAASIAGKLYKYTGESANSWSLLKTVNQAIISLASDNSGNIYLAMLDGSVDKIDYAGNLTSLGSVSNPRSLSFNSNTNQLYLTSDSAIYSCDLANITSNCFVLSSLPILSSINQLLASGNTFYAASSDSSYSYESGASTWSGMESALNQGSITSIALANGGAGTNLYMIESGQVANSSAIYQWSTSSNSFAPVVSTSGANLQGDAYGLISDAGNGLFIIGSNLISSDLATNVYFSYLPSSVLGFTSTPWTTISGLTANDEVVELKTATQLTSY
ncbi:MAG: hypothetical protein RLZZ293_569, partial [Pseudomonadota bacterium]